MNHAIRTLCATVLVFAMLPVQAASDINLYQEREVVSQNADSREQDEAVKEAFQRLLIRVTGIKQVLDYPAIQEQINQGNRYLATFRFESSDEMFTNILGEPVPTKAMILEFDQKSVESLLVQNRLPVWGSKRPDVLIWMADRLDDQDHILADAEESETAQLVDQVAKERGIPYLLPIMDLTDSLSLSFSEVYGLFSSDIEAASERYLPDAILAGRLANQSGDNLQADWLLLFKGERIRLPTVTGSLEEVVESGMDLVAQRLSEQYALILDPLLLGNLTLSVTGVDNLVEFAELEAYLQSINIITKATLSTFGTDEVAFNVEISGDQSQLRDVLALDGQLRPIEEVTLEAQLDSRLVFEWMPE